ncbi:MAG TPA: TetR family transcriptional regulator, partial [Kocuria sp.]|nr:TetR family transcriptional regulator [Kocuria sp.]
MTAAREPSPDRTSPAQNAAQSGPERRAGGPGRGRRGGQAG